MKRWGRAAQTPADDGRKLLVSVRLFARLREEAGYAERTLEVHSGATVADVYNELGLPESQQALRVSRNQAMCAWDEGVDDGDEIGFIPPVSGGAVKGPLIELTQEPLDARRLEAAVAHSGAGAICTFTGVVRDNSEGRSVSRLEYEAYAGMAEAEMRRIADDVMSRWPDSRVAMAHRFGSLAIGQASVVVSVSTPHRAQAFEACRWGIDRLKESVPIWKKEFAEDGSYWVEGNIPDVP